MALIIRLSILAVNVIVYRASLQQDSYLKYAREIRESRLKNLDEIEKRLFPGYPLAVLALDVLVRNLEVSGMMISVACSVGVVIMLKKICDSDLPVWLAVFFPPVWVKAGVKFATEPLFIFMELVSIYLFWKKNYLMAGILAGLAFIVRPIGLMLVLAYGFIHLKEKVNPVKLIAGFAVAACLLAVFNGLIYGTGNMLDQFAHGERYGMTFGLVQMGKDILYMWRWGYYRILASGIFYILINTLALVFLFKNFKKSKLAGLMAVWMTLCLVYIFSFSPSTLIGDFGRYTISCLPALLVGLSSVGGKVIEFKKT